MSGWKPDDEFGARVATTFGAEGRGWLADLPGRIDALAERWQLEELTPLAGLSYAWVAFATRDRSPVVVKLMVSPAEFRSEVHALIRFPAGVACRLLDRDVDASAMLLERLVPGTTLREVASFATRVEVAAETMRRLHLARRPGRRPRVRGVEPSAVAAGAAVDAAVSACWSLEDGESEAVMERTAHRAATIRGFARGWLES